MKSPSKLAEKVRELHREHGFLVLAVLSNAGLSGLAVQDAAQEVWLTVYAKLAAGESEPRSWPAYLTTLAKGRAANDRRAAVYRQTTPIDQSPDTPARGLTIDQILLVLRAIESIPNPDQREALLLRAKGYSIKEIAEIQGITEPGVKKRLEMAGERIQKELSQDSDDEKAGPFWGFGSLEELFDAFSEERERQWKDIEKAIQRTDPPVDGSSTPKPSDAAPVVPTPPKLPFLGPKLVVLPKATLVAIAGGTWLFGAMVGSLATTDKPSAHVAVCPEPTATAVDAPTEGERATGARIEPPAAGVQAQPANGPPEQAPPEDRKQPRNDEPPVKTGATSPAGKSSPASTAQAPAASTDLHDDLRATLRRMREARANGGR